MSYLKVAEFEEELMLQNQKKCNQKMMNPLKFSAQQVFRVWCFVRFENIPRGQSSTSKNPGNPARFNLQAKIFIQVLCRQADGDGAPGTVVVRRSYGAAHQVDEFFYQGQTDSGAAGGAGKGVIHAVKVAKDFF